MREVRGQLVSTWQVAAGCTGWADCRDTRLESSQTCSARFSASSQASKAGNYGQMVVCASKQAQVLTQRLEGMVP